MRKSAYLTIDDSPSAHFAERVKFLTDKDIVAVWFCLGENLMRRRDEVVYAIQKGQIIANHSWSHPHFSEIDSRQGKDQISQTDNLIDEIYAEAGVVRQYKWFRFPYFDRGGRFAEEYQDYLGKLDYSHPRWPGVTYKYFDELRQAKDWPATLDCMEWVYGSRHEAEHGLRSMADVQNRLLTDEPEQGLGLHSGSADIVLIHDHEKPDDRFTSLVNFLLDQGVTFVDPHQQS